MPYLSFDFWINNASILPSTAAGIISFMSNKVLSSAELVFWLVFLHIYVCYAENGLQPMARPFHVKSLDLCFHGFLQYADHLSVHRLWYFFVYRVIMVNWSKNEWCFFWSFINSINPASTALINFSISTFFLSSLPAPWPWLCNFGFSTLSTSELN